jgi:hypothetical protein
MYIGFCYGNLREGGHMENIGVDVRVILKEVSSKNSMS